MNSVKQISEFAITSDNNKELNTQELRLVLGLSLIHIEMCIRDRSWILNGLL